MKNEDEAQTKSTLSDSNTTESPFTMKEFFSDFIVKEIFEIDNKKYFSDSVTLNLSKNEDLMFKNSSKEEIINIYAKILNLQNIMQSKKEENKQNSINLNFTEEFKEISFLYEKLKLFLNSFEEKVEYFFLPEKEKRLQIYESLRNDPFLVYEIIDFDKIPKIDNLCINSKFINSDTHEKNITEKKVLQIKTTISEISQFHLTLKKINKNTENCVFILKKTFENISFSGNKDRRAITYQRFSIKGSLMQILLFNSEYYNCNSEITEDSIKLPSILFSQIVSCRKNLKLGDLVGNQFNILLRNVSKEINILPINVSKEIKAKNLFINYFGDQRFGYKRKNYVIGKFLLEKEFDKAFEVFKEIEGKDYADINAKIFFTKKMRREKRTLFEHSYQSKIVNENLRLLFEILENKNSNIESYADIIYRSGEQSSLHDLKYDYAHNNFDKLMHYQIKLPFTKKLILRPIFFQSEDLSINNLKGNKIRLEFILKPSCYATTLIKQLFS